MQFYETLARRAADKAFVIDIFAGCLDQTGLSEMRTLSNYTNGFMVLSDGFNTMIFKQSFVKMFSKDADGNLIMGFNATMEVQTTRELRVCGLIGPVVSLSKKSSSVGETVCITLYPWRSPDLDIHKELPFSQMAPNLGNWHRKYLCLEVLQHHSGNNCCCIL